MMRDSEIIGCQTRRPSPEAYALPPAPFDACDKQATRVSSLSLVRYRCNDYSVLVAYGHQEVWIRGYVHEVVIGCGGEIIVRHVRSYEREDLVFDPLHYRTHPARTTDGSVFFWELYTVMPK